MKRRVRGILFVDYVRMIRGTKDVDWTRYLNEADFAFLHQTIEPDGWYPMETFERFGIAIGREIVGDQLEAVRMWGRFQVDQVREGYPTLVAEGDPRETLMRFQVLRKSFFDFDALDIVELGGTSAVVAVAFGMSTEAEAKASYQTLGFFERLVELAGGRAIHAVLRDKSWEGAPRTRIALHWRLR